MSNQTEIVGLGVMSGTSLDGIDIAACKFYQKNDNYHYEIIEAKTYHYDSFWKNKLTNAPLLNGEELSKLNVLFGKFLAEKINAFKTIYSDKIEFIASHGHTIFHQPENGFTLQIGSGAEIVANTGIKTICDFRTTDIALKGQGAPLVPIGDQLLFSEYDSCINLGGFANISFNQNKKRIAYDICPVNIALNHYCQKLGKEYDKNGEIAKFNGVSSTLLSSLNQLDFYKKPIPKSLGREWFETVFLKEIDCHQISIEEKIASITHHAAIQISNSIAGKKAIFTGGGAYNQFLIDIIKKHCSAEIYIPNNNIIEFKEALIFAFLGYLRLNNSINTLKSATGANRNSVGGCIYAP